MKNYLYGILASSALIFSGAAQATTYTPSGTYTWSGVFMVQKAPSPAFPCLATLSGFVPNADPDSHGGFDHGHTMTNVTIAFTQFGPTPAGLCETISVRDAPLGSPNLEDNLVWDWSSNELRIEDVYVHTPTPGDCEGNITAVYNGSTGALVVNSSLPGGGASSPCTFAGTLNKTSGGNITNP